MVREPPKDLVALQGLYCRSTTGDVAQANVLSPGKVRLLRIHSPFLLSLEEAPLNDNEYVALSYHWEKDFSLCPITINNREYRIRSYLYEMLYTIHHIHGECCVWTDMLCINQCIKAEKDAQIHLMGDIYGRARRVYAWLGLATPDTNNVFYVLNEFAQKKQQWREGLSDSSLEVVAYRYLLKQIYEDTNGALPATDASCDDGVSDEVKLLAPIYTREYWRRLWIVQELILAKEVMVCCGNRSINLDSIYRLGPAWGPWTHAFEQGALTQLHEPTHGWRIMEAIQDHRRIRDEFVKGVYVQSLTVNIPLDEVVIMYAKEQQCEEKRDKIFAVRELVQQWKERLDPMAYDGTDETILFRDAIDLYFREQPQHLRHWTTMWYLWSTMGLGTTENFDDFKDFAKDYFPPDAIRTMKLEVLPASRPCRRMSIPDDDRVEACRSVPDAISMHIASQIDAWDLFDDMTEILQ